MEAAAGFIRRLAQSAKETFGDFEDAVEKDASKPPVFVESTLSQLFSDGESLLAAAMMPIMPVRQTNLDGKSKLHEDAALTELFLMNDIHYMVEYV
ncbi:unnamed protein product [Sphagnum jensenii]|uniref:Exocyst subunit Exo70 family protein n=1 Tax=Sphagnum jensenii TaxID=128206 RepID=A0ABP1AKE6_9BRYO